VIWFWLILRGVNSGGGGGGYRTPPKSGVKFLSIKGIPAHGNAISCYNCLVIQAWPIPVEFVIAGFIWLFPDNVIQVVITTIFNIDGRIAVHDFQFKDPSIHWYIAPRLGIMMSTIISSIIRTDSALNLWSKATTTPDHSITAVWPLPNYTAWWQRHICVGPWPFVPFDLRTSDLGNFKTNMSSLGTSKFSFSASTLLVWWQEGHPACKKLGAGLLMVTIWLELFTSGFSCYHHFHHPSLQKKIQNGDIPVLANPDPPGKMAVRTKRGTSIPS